MPQGSRKVKGTTPECGKRRVPGSTVESEWESSVCWALINGEVRLLPDILAYKNLKSSTVSSWGFAIYAHWSHLTLTFAKLFSHLWNKETELNYLEGPLRLWHLWEEKHRSGKWLKKSMHPSPFSPLPAQKPTVSQDWSICSNCGHATYCTHMWTKAMLGWAASLWSALHGIAFLLLQASSALQDHRR